MRIPVVLTTVHVTVGHDGRLAVEVDGRPYAGDRVLGRGDLRSLVDEITTDAGTAVRVEVREADGSTFSDIATPPEQAARATTAPSPEPIVPALTGAGFRPGEEVALAYVVSRQEADIDGRAAINLPPALVNATCSGLVLVGLDSMTAAPLERPA